MILIQTKSQNTYAGIRYCFIPFNESKRILSHHPSKVTVVIKDEK